MSSNERIVVGIDVGTTKVSALIAEITDDDRLEIIGVGIVPSRGMRKGLVVNTDEVVESIEAAVHAAEQQSGFKIVSAFVGISGAHIATEPSRGAITVRHPDRQITPEDVARAIDAARAVEVAPDREVLQVLTRCYSVDGQGGIKNPIGMVGQRIEVEATIVSGTASAVHSLQRCVERAGIGIDSLVLQAIAAAEGVLTEAEREVGVAVVDLGGGTTDVGVFADGALTFAAVVPVGGFQISNDIAVGLRTSLATAEEIKIRYGHALSDVIEDDRAITVAGSESGDERPISRREIGEIIEARLEETLYLVVEQLKRADIERLPGGIVICGGTAQLGGLRRLAAEVFRTPVRIGSPTGIYGLTDQVSTPAFAASVGLLRWGIEQEYEPAGGGRGVPLAGIGNALGSWLRNLLP
jgi:cell division protein FtsA